MAAQLMNTDTAYMEGDMDATEEIMEDMRRRRDAQRRRGQDRAARRRYFLIQKTMGTAMLIISALVLFCLDGDGTAALITAPLGAVLLFSRKLLVMDGYYWEQERESKR